MNAQIDTGYINFEVSLFPVDSPRWMEINKASEEIDLQAAIEKVERRDGIYYVAYAEGVFNPGATEKDALNNLIRLINNCLSWASRHEPCAPQGHRQPWKRIPLIA